MFPLVVRPVYCRAAFDSANGGDRLLFHAPVFHLGEEDGPEECSPCRVAFEGCTIW